MDARELRIGNLIKKHDGSILGVTHEILGYLTNYKGEMLMTSPPKYPFMPIPLTKEWLIKMGFKYRKAGVGGQDSWAAYGAWEIGDCYFQGLKDGKVLYYARYRLSQCVYVHQLQNLYHSLTGQELTIKE